MESTTNEENYAWKIKSWRKRSYTQGREDRNEIHSNSSAVTVAGTPDY
jgi:hypothetical protein